MTRFLLSLDDAVDVVFAAVRGANRGETYIPRVPSALMRDLASVMIGDLKLPVKITGIRPGEKVHEILISDEESQRTVERGKYFAIKPMLPEIVVNPKEKAVLMAEFGSADNLMNPDELKALLKRKDLMTPMDEGAMAELLR
jgi:UDP-glucose 4-epimerase